MALLKLFFLFKLSSVTDLKYFVQNTNFFHRREVFVAMLHDDEENFTPSLCDSVMPISIVLGTCYTWKIKQSHRHF